MQADTVVIPMPHEHKRSREHDGVGRRPDPSPVSPPGLTGLLGFGRTCASQRTSVRIRIARNTLWALCTAIPIHALRYRLVGYAVVNISRSVPGIAHGTCRW